MTALSSLPNVELIERLSSAVRSERAASAEVIAQLAELDRRGLYLEEACSSLYSYCIERLGYSEDAAIKRVRVARLARRWPCVLDELASGAMHLTGIFLLSQHLNEDNAESLLAEARGKPRREIEELIARRFPRADVPERMSTWPGTGSSTRVEPLSATSYRLELTISAELHAKIEHLQNLLSHALPNVDLAAVIERSVDQAIEVETRRHAGAGKPRKRREQQAGSRHIPVEVQRAVRERDGHQCTFVDAEGRRCSEKRFVTLEHDMPHALGGPSTEENLRLLCKAHNAYTAREVFGEGHIRNKVVHSRVLSGLVRLGFRRKQAESALGAVEERGVESAVEPLMRAALCALTVP